MTTTPSLTIRIVIGKALGLVFGIITFFLVPAAIPDASPLLAWGLMFWMITLGLMVALMGVVTWHPVLGIPLPWWFRAPLVGAWMNFVLVFLIYDQLQISLINLMGPDSFFLSPFWYVVDGAIIGLIIGFVATRFGGEGKEAVDL